MAFQNRLNAPQGVISVPPEKLPASCPPIGQKGWDKHPRVYLRLSPQTPQQTCPYCGAKYVLVQKT